MTGAVQHIALCYRGWHLWSTILHIWFVDCNGKLVKGFRSEAR